MKTRGINIWRIPKILFRKAAWILFWTLFGGAVLWTLSTFVLTPMYTTSVSLYVYSNENRDDSGMNITSSDLAVSQRLVDTYCVIIKSDTVLNEVIDELKLSVPPEKLRGRIEASSVDNTEVLAISVSDESPKQAQEIANTIARVLPGEIVRIVKAGGVEVVDRAAEPSRPSSPNVGLNTAAGALVGLLMACGIFILKEYFGARIKSEEDLKEYFGAEIPILGTVPKLTADARKEKKNERRK